MAKGALRNLFFAPTIVKSHPPFIYRNVRINLKNSKFEVELADKHKRKIRSAITMWACFIILALIYFSILLRFMDGMETMNDENNEKQQCMKTLYNSTQNALNGASNSNDADFSYHNSNSFSGSGSGNFQNITNCTMSEDVEIEKIWNILSEYFYKYVVFEDYKNHRTTFLIRIIVGVVAGSFYVVHLAFFIYNHILRYKIIKSEINTPSCLTGSTFIRLQK